MSFGKRCVFQLSSISIRILSHTLILRLGYTFLILHSKTSRASRQGWVRRSADRLSQSKQNESKQTKQSLCHSETISVSCIRRINMSMSTAISTPFWIGLRCKITTDFSYRKEFIYTKSPHYQAITRATRKKEKERDSATR